MAVELINKALTTNWQIILKEPRRTIFTLVAAYLLFLLPQSVYSKIEALAVKSKNFTQKRRILQYQVS